MGLELLGLLCVHRAAQLAQQMFVIARIGADITLKRYQRTADTTVELRPVSTSPEHNPIEIGPTTEIVGVVVGAIVGTRCATR